MPFRRRSAIPSLPTDATKEIIAIQDGLSGDTAALRAEAIGATTDTKTANYSARFNEVIRVSPPASGELAITLPAPTALTQNKWVEIILLKAGNVRVRATSGLVNNTSSVLLTAIGRHHYKSDAVVSWWDFAGTATGGGGLPPDGVYGDITVSGGGTVWTVTAGTGTDPRIFAWLGV